jgi:PilZ domain-containing protein
MLAGGTAMFLLIPSDAKERILHPGKVIESSVQSFVVEFEHPIDPPPDSDVIAFGEVAGKFYQQGAIVAEIRRTGEHPVIAFRRNGEPISAENRQIYRVSVVAADIFATIAKEPNCPVADMSSVGLAVISAREHRLGSMVQLDLAYEGKSISVKARIQAVKQLPSGKFRYGLLVPEKTGGARQTLQQISMNLQRTQLRRLAGAA